MININNPALRRRVFGDKKMKYTQYVKPRTVWKVWGSDLGVRIKVMEVQGVSINRRWYQTVQGYDVNREVDSIYDSFTDAKAAYIETLTAAIESRVKEIAELDYKLTQARELTETTALATCQKGAWA
jgi:hypothetical protein